MEILLAILAQVGLLLILCAAPLGALLSRLVDGPEPTLMRAGEYGLSYRD